MKKGFTLLELIVVIIIIGIMATLGLVQYSRMMERARGAEARTVIGAIRTNAAAIYMSNNNNCGTCNSTNLGIDDAADYPATCASALGHRYYFNYNVTSNDANGFIIVASRCTVLGKTPVGPANNNITLTTNFNSGVDTWGQNGGY